MNVHCCFQAIESFNRFMTYVSLCSDSCNEKINVRVKTNGITERKF